MTIQIDDTVLVLDRTFSPTGGMEFRTEIIEWGEGTEQRFQKWEYPLSSWEFGNRVLVNIDNIKTWTEIQSFHAARNGSSIGFYYKDWLDWQGIEQVIAIGNGNQTSFQFVKNYYSNSGTGLARKITRLVQDTVEIKLDNVVASNYSLDLINGIANFGDPPDFGVEIRASYDFYIPVRFVQDNIENRLITLQGGQVAVELGQLTLEEIRLD